MRCEEVIDLRRAFNSVKDRQNINSIKDFLEMKKMLKTSRQLCVGNEDI